MEPINKRYLLCNSIVCYIDENNKRYFDALWCKDLQYHLEYLKNFMIACPSEIAPIPDNFLCIDDDPALSKIKFIDLPVSKSLFQVFRNFPRTTYLISRAIEESDIVQVSVAGRPIPYAWIIVPIIKLFKHRFLLINVESADWRLRKGVHLTLKGVMRAKIVERFNRYCVNQTDLSFFTQKDYKKSLMIKDTDCGHIIHASWIDENMILSEIDVLESWNIKLKNTSNKFRILFAGRLTTSKGILILIDAMRMLASRNVSIQLDILGQGELLKECQDIAMSVFGSVEIKFLGTMPYDLEFHRLIRRYHTIVVPSLSDEQPRIVYDAYSQGVSVMASNTAGLRDCVIDGSTGVLFPLNDAKALAACIESGWSLGMKKMQEMGLMAHKKAIGMTHSNMHKKRHRLLLEALSAYHQNIKKC